MSRSRSRSSGEDKKKRKREKDEKRKKKSRSRSINKQEKDSKRKRSQSPRDKKKRKSSVSIDEKKKIPINGSKRRESPSHDRKKKKSRSKDRKKRSISRDKKRRSTSKDRKRRSISKEEKKKRSGSKDKKRKISPEKRRQSRSSSKDRKSHAFREKSPELTLEQKQQLDIKKQRERLARMRMMKFDIPDNSDSDSDKDNSAVTKKPKLIDNATSSTANDNIQRDQTNANNNLSHLPPQVQHALQMQLAMQSDLPIEMQQALQKQMPIDIQQVLQMQQNIHQQQQQNGVLYPQKQEIPLYNQANQSLPSSSQNQEQFQAAQSLQTQQQSSNLSGYAEMDEYRENEEEEESSVSEETLMKRILHDSDGLEEESDQDNGEDNSKQNGQVKYNINPEKLEKLQKITTRREEQEEYANVFTSKNNNTSSLIIPLTIPNRINTNNILASINSSQAGQAANSTNSSIDFARLSMNDTFNSHNKTLNQQEFAEESEEDELDAYCRQLEETLQKENPILKGVSQGIANGNTNVTLPQQNYITMEEIFGRRLDEDDDILQEEDDQDEFSIMKRQERMELEQNSKMKGEGQQDNWEPQLDEQGDDDHYLAFKEAMRKKKDEMLKDNTGALMMDEEQEDDEKVVLQDMEKGENKEDYMERLKREALRKELKPIEYKEEDLEPFRKNFYIESREILSMTEEEVKIYRENLGDIQVKGIDVPRPIKTWFQTGLSDKILHILVDKKKYDKPFPIQCQSLPVIMSGRDTLGIAETGSGKTLAYLLPMIRHIADQRPLEEGDGPIGLILVPTRELATQIYMEARPFLKPYKFEIVAVFGGTGIKGQLSELKRGCEIVVCTPGRLIDVLTTSNGKITNLKRVTMVVIDEADRMFDLGFEPQIAKILATTRPDKQTALFSATFPKNVENLAKKLMRNKPCEIVVGAKGQACTNITQIIEIRDEQTRIYRLLELLGTYTEKGQVIIFVDKQFEVDQLYTQLRQQYYAPTILHAGVDAEDRNSNLLDFKKGIYKILIATSVSSRGIDVKNVVLVVNYRCPNHIEDYIHRIGRTGRAGNKGTAVTFLGPDEDKYSLDLIKALKRSDQNVPEELLMMGEEFKKKVKAGEARIYNNANMQGKGFSFDEDEKDMQNKQKYEQKKFLAIQMGLDIEEKEDEDIFKRKGLEDAAAGVSTSEKKKEKKNELTFQQKLHIVMTQEEYKDLWEELLSESTKVANQRKNQGQSEDSIKKATEEILRKGLEGFKPATKNVDLGKIEVAKMLQEFEKNNEEANNQIIAELEINDYPENARKSVTRRDFLDRIYYQTGCTLIQRGVLVEPGKKVQPGFQKLYLRIEGDSEHKVRMAYKDIKTELEERSIRMHERGQHTGKFTVP